MKLPLLFALLAATLPPAFAAVIPVRVATVEQTAHAAERQIPGRIEAIHTVELRARTEGVITKIHFRDGQYVKKGDVLMVLEAMKMENEIMCPRDGVVASVNTSKGATVESGTLLCVLQ